MNSLLDVVMARRGTIRGDAPWAVRVAGQIASLHRCRRTIVKDDPFAEVLVDATAMEFTLAAGADHDPSFGVGGNPAIGKRRVTASKHEDPARMVRQNVTVDKRAISAVASGYASAAVIRNLAILKPRPAAVEEEYAGVLAAKN